MRLLTELLVAVVVVAGCATPDSPRISSPAFASVRLVDACEAPPRLPPLEVVAWQRRSPDERAAHLAEALGQRLLGGADPVGLGEERGTQAWDTSNGSIVARSGGLIYKDSNGWANKTFDESKEAMQMVVANLGGSELVFISGEVAQYHQVRMAQSTVAGYLEALLARNVASAPYPLTIWVGPQFVIPDGGRTFEEAIVQAKRYEECRPPSDQGSSGENVTFSRGERAAVVESRLVFSVEVQYGQGSDDSCSDDGCVHGCPAPSRLIFVDVETLAVLDWQKGPLCM